MSDQNGIKGFSGKILQVNLTSNEITTIPLNYDWVERFLGGAGYAAAYLIENLSKDTDPLGPDNILFLMGGPLLATSAVSSSRVVILGKSPLSGILGESSTGGQIGVALKKAGYDGLIIKGASETPVFIEIDDDNVKISDANSLWGKGIYETHKLLKERSTADGKGSWKKAKVMCIGPAGENLVKYAIIGSEERAFGRCGLGAVMGSKKLKAVVIKGNKKPEVADTEAFKSQNKKVAKQINEIFTVQMFRELGTSGGINMYALSGEIPVKYYRTSDIKEEEADQISGATLQEQYLKKNRYCYSCAIGCGRIVEVGENNESLPKSEFEGPEYETIAGFGSMLGNYKMIKIIKSNYLCNDLGLDTISSSSVISLLMDFYNSASPGAPEVVKDAYKSANYEAFKKELNGLELDWGNMESVEKLLEMIALRQGIGNIAADGSDFIGEKFGLDQEQIVTIRHIEPPYHDLRSSNGMSIAYAMGPHYGASHCSCDMYQTSLGQAHEDMGIESIDPKDNSPLIVEHTAKLMEYRAFYSSLNMCVFCNPPASEIAKMIETGTGMEYSVDRIKEVGERVLSLKRLFNIKMGHSPKDERLPKILLTPLDGSTERNVPDVDKLFDEFYKYEQWDPETGMPSPEKIARLGLNDFVNK